MRIEVSLDPAYTAFSLLHDVASGCAELPLSVKHPIRSVVRPHALAGAFAPVMATPRGGFLPDAVVSPWHGDSDLATFTAWLGDAGAQSLETQLATTDLDVHGPAWQRSPQHAGQWVEHYLSVVRSGSPVLDAIWSRADAEVQREIERVGRASVRGHAIALLNTLSTRVTFSDDSLWLDGRPVASTEGKTIELVPMVAAADSMVLGISETTVKYAYSVHGSRRLLSLAPDTTSPDRDDYLESMIGRTRAGIVRMLESPQTMTTLSRQLDLSPSTVTHHCDYLVNAGLATRVRSKNHVYLHLTSMGLHLANA